MYKRDEIEEIYSLEIDFDNNKLIINGKPVTDRPVIVTTVSGPDGWPLQKVYNAELVDMQQKELKTFNRLMVAYVKAE